MVQLHKAAQIQGPADAVGQPTDFPAASSCFLTVPLLGQVFHSVVFSRVRGLSKFLKSSSDPSILCWLYLRHASFCCQQLEAANLVFQICCFDLGAWVMSCPPAERRFCPPTLVELTFFSVLVSILIRSVLVCSCKLPLALWRVAK